MNNTGERDKDRMRDGKGTWSMMTYIVKVHGIEALDSLVPVRLDVLLIYFTEAALAASTALRGAAFLLLTGRFRFFDTADTARSRSPGRRVARKRLESESRYVGGYRRRHRRQSARWKEGNGHTGNSSRQRGTGEYDGGVRRRKMRSVALARTFPPLTQGPRNLKAPNEPPCLNPPRTQL